MNGIVVCSMLQPDADMLELFDNLIILEKGNIIYSGPSKSAIDYFHEIGYIIPDDEDIGTFLCKMGSSSFRKSLSPNAKVHSVDEMSKYYKLSKDFQNVSNKISKSLNTFQDLNINRYCKKIYNTQHPLDSFTLFITLLHRQFQLIIRDKPYLLGRMIQNLLIGLMLGYLYSDVYFIYLFIILLLIVTKI